MTEVDLIPLANFLPRDIWPYMALMIAGFMVGVSGHMVRSKLMIITGILMIFVATVVFPIAINLTHETPREVRDLATRSRP